jgi:hypothetical protein
MFPKYASLSIKTACIRNTFYNLCQKVRTGSEIEHHTKQDRTAKIDLI